MRPATAMRGLPLHKNRWQALQHCPTSQTKVRRILIRGLLFADDAALVSHSVTHLLVDRFAHACKEFGLTISPKKTKNVAKDSDIPPVITIDGQPLEVVRTFTYLGSTVSSSVNLDSELNSRIGKAAIEYNDQAKQQSLEQKQTYRER